MLYLYTTFETTPIKNRLSTFKGLSDMKTRALMQINGTVLTANEDAATVASIRDEAREFAVAYSHTKSHEHVGCKTSRDNNATTQKYDFSSISNHTSLIEIGPKSVASV